MTYRATRNSEYSHGRQINISLAPAIALPNESDSLSESPPCHRSRCKSHQRCIRFHIALSLFDVKLYRFRSGFQGKNSCYKYQHGCERSVESFSAPKRYCLQLKYPCLKLLSRLSESVWSVYSMHKELTPDIQSDRLHYSNNLPVGREAFDV